MPLEQAELRQKEHEWKSGVAKTSVERTYLPKLLTHLTLRTLQATLYRCQKGQSKW